jgi:hypothetical protein
MSRPKSNDKPPIGRMLRSHSLTLTLALLGCSFAISKASDDPGHSRHGTAFDSGLRQRPWKMEGIGHTHFSITTKVPEVTWSSCCKRSNA